jgi:predicted metal-binding protein
VTTVLLCRGCCCGTSAKHPGTDHEAQATALADAAPAGVQVRVVACLDVCDRSNVVVLRQGKGSKDDTWLGGVLTQRASEALVGYVAAGAKGELPDAVRGLRFRHKPPRRR